MTPQPSLLPAEIDALEKLARAAIVTNDGRVLDRDAWDLFKIACYPKTILRLCAAARSASSKKAEIAHAARYRWLREHPHERRTMDGSMAELDFAIDAKIFQLSLAAFSADRENPDDGKETE